MQDCTETYEGILQDPIMRYASGVEGKLGALGKKKLSNLLS